MRFAEQLAPSGAPCRISLSLCLLWPRSDWRPACSDRAINRARCQRRQPGPLSTPASPQPVAQAQPSSTPVSRSVTSEAAQSPSALASLAAASFTSTPAAAVPAERVEPAPTFDDSRATVTAGRTAPVRLGPAPLMPQSAPAAIQDNCDGTAGNAHRVREQHRAGDRSSPTSSSSSRDISGPSRSISGPCSASTCYQR